MIGQVGFEMSYTGGKKYEIDMNTGALFPKLLLFSVPLMLSGVFQLLFNAADMIVIGKYASTDALAAIGGTSSLINFFVNVAIGISIGSNVIVAHYFGASRKKEIHDAVHTSIMLALIFGTVIGIIAEFACPEILALMKTGKDDPAVLEYATLYVRIYFAGLPIMMIYNFGSAILRAVGDTKRPLYYLTAAGFINVILNLFFVCKLKMSVDGVALATVISQGISAALVIRCLMKTEGAYKLIFKDLRLNRHIAAKILKVGLPAGVQGMIFSLSNILIQSSVNDFGKIAMAGNTASMSLEGFVYTAMNSFYQTAISFTGQNLGGGKYSRINKIMIRCVLLVFIVGFVMGNLFYLAGRPLLSLYVDKDSPAREAMIDIGLRRMKIIMTTYFTCGMMDVMCGMIRGLGYGIMPMMVSLIGACGFRIIWIFTFFRHFHSLENLYISYPISWVITGLVHFICFVYVRSKLPKKDAETAAASYSTGI